MVASGGGSRTAELVLITAQEIVLGDIVHLRHSGGFVERYLITKIDSRYEPLLQSVILRISGFDLDKRKQTVVWDRKKPEGSVSTSIYPITVIRDGVVVFDHRAILAQERDKPPPPTILSRYDKGLGPAAPVLFGLGGAAIITILSVGLASLSSMAVWVFLGCYLLFGMVYVNVRTR